MKLVDEFPENLVNSRVVAGGQQAFAREIGTLRFGVFSPLEEGPCLRLPAALLRLGSLQGAGQKGLGEGHARWAEKWIAERGGNDKAGAERKGDWNRRGGENAKQALRVIPNVALTDRACGPPKSFMVLGRPRMGARTRG